MEVIITKSKKKDKKLDAIIDGKKRLALVQKVILILHNLKAQNKNKDI